MPTPAAQDLRQLLAQAEVLRDRFEVHSPNSARLNILVKDCARLRRELAAMGA
jgi:hypothetical protein